MWRSSDALLSALLLSLGSLPTLVCRAAAPAPTAASAASANTSQTVSPAAECLLSDAARARRIKNVKALIAFYQTWNPAALEELKNAVHAPRRAKTLAKRLLEHYMELQRVRRRFPDEYKRLLQIEKMESECIALGRKIRRLRLEQKRAAGEERKRIEQELAGAEKELRALLDRVFVARQQNQTIAVTRLEAELRELRALLKQREANRQDILANRFRQLAGSDEDGQRISRSPAAAVPVEWDW